MPQNIHFKDFWSRTFCRFGGSVSSAICFGHCKLLTWGSDVDVAKVGPGQAAIDSTAMAADAPKTLSFRGKRRTNLHDLNVFFEQNSQLSSS